MGMGYTHKTVNHNENFVNPECGVHTQTVESQWQKVKATFKQQYGCAEGTYKTYFPEYMWRKKFGSSEEIMYNFWSHVSDIHPCNK